MIEKVFARGGKPNYVVVAVLLPFRGESGAEGAEHGAIIAAMAIDDKIFAQR